MTQESKQIESEHPLTCKNCSDFYFIEFHKTKFSHQNKSIGITVPFFVCKSCKREESVIPNSQFYKLISDISNGLEDGKTYLLKAEKAFPLLNRRKKFKHLDHLGFKYDSRDYYLIPGLNTHDDGYLMPVFFNKDLLLYYNNHPDYSVKLYSFSSGNIYKKSKPMFRWGFGINRAGKIFKWLGDLNEDFKKPNMKAHLKRFQASNIKSDNDIISQFYFSQIPFNEGNFFQESDNELKLFELKNLFEENVLADFRFIFSKIEIIDLPEKYKHPILNERQQVFETYLELTKLLIENIQEKELRKILLSNAIAKLNFEKKQNKKAVKLGGLKLFELFITHLLKQKNGSELTSPLFVLYDLRLLHGHLADNSFKDKYNKCKSRLNLQEGASDLKVYEALITALIMFYSNLCKSFANATTKE